MRKILIPFCLIFAFGLMSCANKQLNKIVGADRDEHGCIGSAGYRWSYALNQCVRVWEAGERIDGPSESIFLIYSDDSLFAEVFTQDARHFLCKRVKGTNTWRPKRGRESVSINNGIITVNVDNYTYTKGCK